MRVFDELSQRVHGVGPWIPWALDSTGLSLRNYAVLGVVTITITITITAFAYLPTPFDPVRVSNCLFDYPLPTLPFMNQHEKLLYRRSTSMRERRIISVRSRLRCPRGTHVLGYSLTCWGIGYGCVPDHRDRQNCGECRHVTTIVYEGQIRYVSYTYTLVSYSTPFRM